LGAAAGGANVQVTVDIPAGALGGEIDLSAWSLHRTRPTTSVRQISTTAKRGPDLDVAAADGKPGAPVYIRDGEQPG
jgi:hypothetical protein